MFGKCSGENDKPDKQKPRSLAASGFDLVDEWCSGRDLNPHAFRHMPLKHACLPIPPPERWDQGFGVVAGASPAAGVGAGAAGCSVEAGVVCSVFVPAF